MPALKRKYRDFILLASLSVIVLGAYVLAYGLLLTNGVMDAESLGSLPMATDSAGCFILAGFSLGCLLIRTKNGAWCIISKICCLLVIVWCSLLLVRDFSSIRIPVVFGMSPQTGLCFLLLSLAIFSIRVKKCRYFVQCLLHIVTVTSSIVLVGHILNIPEFYKFTFIPMAIYTAIGLVMMSVAASLVNPRIGITGLFTGNLIGNLMARNLFFKMLIAILILGFFRIFAHRQHWVSVELGSALVIVIFVLISLALIWRTSHSINKIDVKRKIAIENFTMAVQAAPYALIISDRDGIIKVVNEHAKLLYGYKKEELIDKNLKIIVPEMLQPAYDTRRDSFFSEPATLKFGHNEEVLAKRKDGTVFPIEFTMTPVKTSTEMYVLATITDVTQRKNQEDIIKKQLIELQVKNEELEQFNYISSHDLQEPLRTVSNYIQMIGEDYTHQIEGEIKEHLNVIASAVDRMSHVVKSLLNFGKLGRKKKLVLTNCNELVGDVITDLSSLIKNTDAQIVVQKDLPYFYAYETELRQLFQNLVNNAIKFREDDVRPEIKIGCHDADSCYEFYVSDNGIGIDSRHYDKIFHIFHRLNNDDQYEGHGIGLANCKKIAEMHGGQIWVESTPGKGSTFKFTIFKLRP